MKTFLTWSPQAEEDLLEICIAIATDSERAADHLFDRIVERISMLAKFPRLGVRRPDVWSGARILVEGQYLILHEIHPDTHVGTVDEVEVIRILHGKRNMDDMF